MTTDNTTGAEQVPTPVYPGAPAPVAAPAPAAPVPVAGQIGTMRSTGLCIVLAIVTLGIYQIVWYFKVHSEMKRHTGAGLGGGIALLLTLFVGSVMPYITSAEVGNLYTGKGQKAPVGGATGLWFFPGIFILVGPLVWFIKTNGALNDYWRSQGATS